MGEQAGRLVARGIAAEGVDTIFTLSGGHVMPVYEGCRLEGVRVIDVRHEQAAAHAAEAWGRINRACGVALVTAGPGVRATFITQHTIVKYPISAVSSTVPGSPNWATASA